MSTEVLATVSASTPRRILGVAMLAALGALLLYLALQASQGALWTLFFVALGLGAIWLALRMWQATAASVILTAHGLHSSDGTLIAALDDIVVVERGVLAMKPSNGFMLRTKTSLPRGWQPGLWWRLGKRVGIGGVTPGGQSKTMSEILAALTTDKSLIEQIQNGQDQS